jgi:glycosyltransferase involved in cell wall biosynthesis/Tfp pilus assembly protein PilF
MSAAPRVSLCMIVRDSSRTLEAALESIKPWVDEIIVVDTGSTDNSRQIALRYSASVFEVPWCDDFSSARNASLERATGDWLFWMDSDDTISIENGRKLRALADKDLASAPTAYVMQVHCPGPQGSADVTIVDHVKMFQNDRALRFEGRIHEQILPAIRRNNGNVEWTDVYVTHSGVEHSAAAKKRKQQRDLRLLQMELAERPGHSFVLFNLGMTHADMEQWHTAVEYLKRSLQVSSACESHVRKAYALLVECLLQLNLDEEATQFLNQGLNLFFDDPELNFRRGILEHRAKNYDCAVAAFHAALANRGEHSFSSRDHGITGYKARHNLATLYRELGQLDHSELQLRLALTEQPTYRDGWRRLAETLLDQKKYTTLEAEIETAESNCIPPDELACIEAKLAAHRGTIGAAIEILNRTISLSTEIAEPLRLKCQLLFEHCSIDEAIAALEELCRFCPEDGAAWHNLGTANHKAGRTDLAISCYKKSLTVRPQSEITMIQLTNAQNSIYQQGQIQLFIRDEDTNISAILENPIPVPT